jgi:two-component system chemotaxis response regulator CheY
MIAIFAAFPEARKRDEETARDLGVHDMICRPVSPKTVTTKLRAMLVAPRPFIAAPSFFGPDRRAVQVGGPPPRERRQRATRKVSVAMV